MKGIINYQIALFYVLNLLKVNFEYVLNISNVADLS